MVMVAWALYIHVNCAEPRIEFREFYRQTTASPWPGRYAEEWNSVNKRLADALANYIDYSEAYRDQCK
jgi:hypothetical protein